MLKLNRIYFLFTIILLIAEVLIGAYVHDDFIRPFGGDFLVVILIYCLIKSFINNDVNYTLLSVLLFAYLIEFSQWYHLVSLVGLEHSSTARMVMGTDFAWMDMLMYTLGIMVVWIIERVIKCL